MPASRVGVVSVVASMGAGVLEGAGVGVIVPEFCALALWSVISIAVTIVARISAVVSAIFIIVVEALLFTFTPLDSLVYDYTKSK